LVRASGIHPEGPGFNPRSGHFYKFNMIASDGGVGHDKKKEQDEKRGAWRRGD